MRGGNESSVLASRAKELEHNMKKDVVHRELESRPELSEMKERGLLSGCVERASWSDPGVSNSLAATASALDHNMKKDAVSVRSECECR